MTTVQRICEKCGEAGPLDARHCPHCGFDSQATLPVPTRNLPMVIGKAALPLLAGAASLALRAGWKLLQQRLATTPVPTTLAIPKTAPTQSIAHSSPPATQSRRRIHIRSTWAIGDANGIRQQGSSEHTIEFED
ncbi:MAG: zinc ribbon domain-containing protein [Caldilineaceae bacterium]